MRILIACEVSGKVRRAFRARGHDAFSCDLQPADDKSKYHVQGDVLLLLKEEWDLVIAFPPCTDLTSSGAKHFALKKKDGRQQRSIEFFLRFTNLPHVPRVAIENPVGIMSSVYKKPSQIIQPWMFGHGETKATCLWLKNLPNLKPTQVVRGSEFYLLDKQGPGRAQRIHKLPPTKNRSKIRSETFTGVAEAMGQQWGGKPLPPILTSKWSVKGGI